MAWLNIIAILILFFMGDAALVALRDYEAQRRSGVQACRFDPEALGIRGADFWREEPVDAPPGPPAAAPR
jgi:AGCS family alanine or glycine:cation symporter